MRFGVEIVTLGPYADPRRVVELAVAAEEAGFELVAVWDHLAFTWGVPSADPLVTLSAVAQATSHIRLLPFVTPLARHRPHVLAWQLACLDMLSDGRLVLGAGLGGVEQEFSAFGEDDSAAVRAARTDEALEVVTRLWSGEKVDHRGQHYRVEGVELQPLPVQPPRPPIWIGGESDGAMRRAARWDGWAASGVGEDGQMIKSVADVEQTVGRLKRAGARLGEGFAVVLTGVTRGPGAVDARSYESAGVTWWLESLSPTFGERDELLRRVRAGPPR